MWFVKLLSVLLFCVLLVGVVLLPGLFWCCGFWIWLVRYFVWCLDLATMLLRWVGLCVFMWFVLLFCVSSFADCCLLVVG